MKKLKTIKLTDQELEDLCSAVMQTIRTEKDAPNYVKALKRLFKKLWKENIK